jgi:hypothetical protein
MDGVTKLVNPAARTLLTGSSGSLATGGGGSSDGVRDSRPARRKVTLDSSLRNMFDFCLSFWGASSIATLAFSFPLLFLGVMVANSSVDGGAGFLDRVAVRRLCSRDERMRKNALVEDSGAGWDTFEKAEGCWEREEDACEAGPGLRWFVMIWKGPETVIFGLCTVAAAMGDQ